MHRENKNERENEALHTSHFERAMHTRNERAVYRGDSLIRTPPPQDLTVGLCPGPYGGPKGGAISCERGTPVEIPVLNDDLRVSRLDVSDVRMLTLFFFIPLKPSVERCKCLRDLKYESPTRNHCTFM